MTLVLMALMTIFYDTLIDGHASLGVQGMERAFQIVGSGK